MDQFLSIASYVIFYGAFSAWIIESGLSIYMRLKGLVTAKKLKADFVKGFERDGGRPSFFLPPNAPTITSNLVRPRPLVLDKPPHYATYVRKDSDPAATCSCHDRPIAEGQSILVWPVEELLCEETYSQGEYRL